MPLSAGRAAAAASGAAASGAAHYHPSDHHHKAASMLSSVMGSALTSSVMHHVARNKKEEEEKTEQPVDHSSDAKILKLLQITEIDATDEENLHWFADSVGFKAFISIAVGLSCMQMGLETGNKQWTSFWQTCEYTFTGIFFFEAALKILIFRFSYFQTMWNMVDFALVLLAIVDIFILGSLSTLDLQSLSVFRIFRLMRLVRVVRLVKRMKKFVLILESVSEALSCTVWVSGVLLLAIYVGAIFLTSVMTEDISKQFPGYSVDAESIDQQDWMLDFNPHKYFGSLGASMLTLFNVTLLAEWPELVWPLFYKQPLLILFFILFALFITMGIMNVIVGMIVENVMENVRNMAQDEKARDFYTKLGVLYHVQALFNKLDTDNTNTVNYEELQKGMNDRDSELSHLLNQIDLPKGFDAGDLFLMLDDDGNQELSHDEFVSSFYRIIDCGSFQQMCMLQKGVNHVKFMINNLSNETIRRHEKTEKTLEAIAAAVANVNRRGGDIEWVREATRLAAAPEAVTSEHREGPPHPAARRNPCILADLLTNASMDVADGVTEKLVAPLASSTITNLEVWQDATAMLERAAQQAESLVRELSEMIHRESAPADASTATGFGTPAFRPPFLVLA